MVQQISINVFGLVAWFFNLKIKVIRPQTSLQLPISDHTYMKWVHSARQNVDIHYQTPISKCCFPNKLYIFATFWMLSCKITIFNLFFYPLALEKLISKMWQKFWEHTMNFQNALTLSQMQWEFLKRIEPFLNAPIILIVHRDSSRAPF